MLKQVTLSECDVPHGHEAVAYRKPVVGEQCCNPNGRIYTATCSESCCLIVRPIPPSLVPLGPEDVVPGMIIHHDVWPTTYWQGVTPTLRMDGVYRIVHSEGTATPIFETFASLMKSYQYKTPSMPAFAPCSKPA